MLRVRMKVPVVRNPVVISTAEVDIVVGGPAAKIDQMKQNDHQRFLYSREKKSVLLRHRLPVDTSFQFVRSQRFSSPTIRKRV